MSTNNYGNNDFLGIKKLRKDFTNITTQNNTSTNIKVHNIEVDDSCLMNCPLTVAEANITTLNCATGFITNVTVNQNAVINNNLNVSNNTVLNNLNVNNNTVLNNLNVSTNTVLNNATINRLIVGSMNGFSTVTGYIPLTWAVSNAGSYVTLATTPNYPSLINHTTVSHALKIPTNAFIYSIIFTNNGITINPTTEFDYVNVYISNTVNSSGVQINTGLSSNQLNSNINTGQMYVLPSCFPTNSGNNYVNVYNVTKNTTGSLAVTICYYIPS